MTNYQILEVIVDGKVSYVERHTNTKGIYEYAPYGGGFLMTLPSRAIVREIESLPDNKVLGYCSIDDGERIKCVCNPLDRWNGWAKPYIFESELPKFLKPFEGDDYYHVTMDGTTIVIKCDEEESRIELVNGFYNVGNEGWIWDFETEEQYQQSLTEEQL